MIYEVQIRSNKFMCSNALKVLKDFVGRQTNELSLSDFLASVLFELYDQHIGEKEMNKTSLTMNNIARQLNNKIRNVTLVNSSSITSLTSETSATSKKSNKSNKSNRDKSPQKYTQQSCINTNNNQVIN